jgi:hypothetical protein
LIKAPNAFPLISSINDLNSYFSEDRYIDNCCRYSLNLLSRTENYNIPTNECPFVFTQNDNKSVRILSGKYEDDLENDKYKIYDTDSNSSNEDCFQIASSMLYDIKQTKEDTNANLSKKKFLLNLQVNLCREINLIFKK